jgi:hypothetical protein
VLLSPARFDDHRGSSALTAVSPAEADRGGRCGTADVVEGLIGCQTALMGDVAARTVGRVAANGMELAYETFGDASAPPVVLIMGWATQMIAWPDQLCDGLARCGLFVVRFDNRDVGRSTHLRNLPPPRLADIVVRRRPPPYSIGDIWATTCPGHCGQSSSGRSRRSPRWANSARDRQRASREVPGGAGGLRLRLTPGPKGDHEQVLS